MDLAGNWLMGGVGPAVVQLVLAWLVIRAGLPRNRRDGHRASQGAGSTCRANELRRRGGTDQP